MVVHGRLLQLRRLAVDSSAAGLESNCWRGALRKIERMVSCVNDVCGQI